MAQTTVIESKKLSGGVTDHDALNNLDYASAGHTGFEPAITAGTSSQVILGDKTLGNLPDTTTVEHRTRFLLSQQFLKF